MRDAMRPYARHEKLSVHPWVYDSAVPTTPAILSLRPRYFLPVRLRPSALLTLAISEPTTFTQVYPGRRPGDPPAPGNVVSTANWTMLSARPAMFGRRPH